MTENDSTTKENDIITMLENVFEKYPQIDQGRVYVEGLSRGGLNSIDLGLTQTKTFAAVGSHSCGTMANFYEDLYKEVDGKASDLDIPFYFIAGTKDHFVPLQDMGEDGGVYLALRLFEHMNDMDMTEFADITSGTNEYFGIDLDGYGEVENAGSLKVYGGTLTNENGVEISLNAIDNWGHWNYQAAAELMWNFFQKYSRNTETGELIIEKSDFLFDDVQDPEKSFYEPVYWAYENGITTGTSEEPPLFSPFNTCTRAQFVTFLWRQQGKPEPTLTESPFTDVQNKELSYYKAVLWAVENKITTGTSETTFDPGKKVTRAQAVTFLWRANNKPAPKTTVNPFKDVAAGLSYSDAVVWAFENNITTGTSATTFNPGGDCTRGATVTFLWRTYAKN